MLPDGHAPLDPRRKGLVWLMQQIKTADRSTCWEYPFTRDYAGDKRHLGYGRMRWNGKMERAHRIAWMLDNGRELPAQRNMVLMHQCDNPPCCNPDHLTLGRQSRNALEAYDRGLKGYGTDIKCAKLDDDKVREIRARADEPQMVLAREFGVSQTTISQVIHRHIWKRVA